MLHEVQAADLKPGEGRAVNAGGVDIAIFNLGGKLYAIQNSCPHRGGPLAEGSLEEDGVVICPWHGYSFSVVTGDPYGFPYGIKTYPVSVENGKVFVDVE